MPARHGQSVRIGGLGHRRRFEKTDASSIRWPLANPSSVLILSLDTTTRGGSVAVLADDRVLALVEGDGTRTHGERLPGELERALDEAGQPLSRD